MSFKRYSKLLFVVLALALWASTAYGQTLTPGPAGPYSLTYTVGDGGSQTGASQAFTISDSADGPNLVAGVPTSGILFNCTGYSVTSASPISCTITLDPSVWDAMAPGSHVGNSVQLTTDGTSDTNITVNVTVVPALNSTNNAFSLVHQMGNGAVISATQSISASDGSAQTYTAINSGCPAWISWSSLDTTYTTPDTLTFLVNNSAADVAGVTASSCNVLLKDSTGATFQSVAVTYQITAATALTATSPVALSYTVNTETATTANSTPTANYDGTVYTAVSDQPWLTVTPNSTLTANTVGTGGSTQLTFTVGTAMADALPLGLNAAHVALSIGGVLSTTVTVNLTVAAGATTLTSAPASVTFVYVKGSNVAPASQPTTLTDTRSTDTYTVGSLAAAPWLTAVSTNNHSIITGSDVLTYSIDATQAELKALGSYSFNVQLTAANELAKTVVVTLNVVDATTLSATSTTLSFTNYAKPGGTAPVAVTTTISDSNASTDNYTIASLAATPWLHCVTGTGSVGNGVTDTVTCNVVTAQADALNAGPQSVTVHLQLAGQADLLLTVNLTITAPASPLTSNPTAITLNYLIGGGANQATALKTASISSTDLAWDNYSVPQPQGWPTWLAAVTSANSFKAKAGGGNSDTLTFKAVSASVPANAGSYQYLVNLHIDSFNADRQVVVTLNVLAQTMVSTPASVALTYTKPVNGGAGGGTQTLPASIAVLTGSPNAPFTVDQSTIPVWLTVTPPNPATATVAGVNVTFTLVSAVVQGMATGNYSASVHLINSLYPTPLVIPVSLSISNVMPTLGLKEGTTDINSTFAKGSTDPVPTWTPYSSNEPVPFTAACTLTTTETYTVTASSCQLNSTSGVAYTLGYGLNATLDHALFAGAGATYGNTVTVKVVVTPQTGSAISLQYVYKLQPTDPAITTISPTSVAVPTATNSTNSLIVLVNGSGFVAPGDIYNNQIVDTQVWLGSAANPIAQSSYVVLSPTQMMVTVPAASLPAIASGKTSNTLAIGLANQTDKNAPTVAKVSKNLTVTQSPVIYGITSTATFVQPNLGNNPNVAAYELVSIFGDQFLGLPPTTVSSVTAGVTPNPLVANKVPVALMIGGTTAKPTNLSVTFKDAATGKVSFSAPILFANQTQINAIVPSGMTIASTYNVTVTSGTATSDPFAVSVVAADPGIFTLASDGTGPGAIVNVVTNGAADGSVNGASHAVKAGDVVSIYLTGLGAPDSVARDLSTNPGGFSVGCVAISNATKDGYMQLVNAPPANSGFTAAKPAWTSIDGAVLQAGLVLGAGLPPCMTDPVTVTFGLGPAATQATVANGGVTWAGLGFGSVAGLYQINAIIPPNTPTGTIPVQVTINSSSSPANTVTMVVH